MSQTRSIAFTKMNGLGNDFVVIDARSERLALAEEEVRASLFRAAPWCFRAPRSLCIACLASAQACGGDSAAGPQECHRH